MTTQRIDLNNLIFSIKTDNCYIKALKAVAPSLKALSVPYSQAWALSSSGFSQVLVHFQTDLSGASQWNCYPSEPRSWMAWFSCVLAYGASGQEAWWALGAWACLCPPHCCQVAHPKHPVALANPLREEEKNNYVITRIYQVR